LKAGHCFKAAAHTHACATRQRLPAPLMGSAPSRPAMESTPKGAAGPAWGSGLLAVDPTMRGRAPGAKVVYVQRHGRTSKNIILKERKVAYQATVNAAVKGGGQVSDCQETFDLYRAAVNEPRWFDDVLDAVGVTQALKAGRDVAKFADAPPELYVTSPFRRAAQTQTLGARAAGFEAVGLVGEPGGAAWVARDELGETPFSETSCMRHTTSVLRQWFPLLDVSGLAEDSPTEWPTGLEAEFGVNGADLKPIVRKRAKKFVEWLRTRPETIIWVTTHQGPADALLREMLGESFSTDRGYDTRLANAQVVVLALPP